MSIVRHRRFPARILAAAILAGLASGSAAAQDDPEVEALTRIRSFIEFGLGFVDDDSYRFGRYRGLEESGGYGVLAIDWYRRAPHDSEDPVYTRLQATRKDAPKRHNARYEGPRAVRKASARCHTADA